MARPTMLARTRRTAERAVGSVPSASTPARRYALAAVARRVVEEDEDEVAGGVGEEGRRQDRLGLRRASAAYRQTIRDKIARHDAAHPPSSSSHPILFPAGPSSEPSQDLQGMLAAHRTSPRRHTHPLVDNHQRKHSYLRISLTERCNLRCTYCMPAEGVPLSPASHILTHTEILRLARLFVSQGVTKIRLTGGEPTLRRGLVELVRELGALRASGLDKICMTSNGLVLHRRLGEMVQAGLTHLNLSLDTLDPAKFEHITRRKGHHAVLASLDAALALLRPAGPGSAPGPGLHSVKLNVVLTRDVNLDEMLAFVRLTRDRPLSVRFIEFMPFSGNAWDKHRLVPYAEALGLLRAEHGDALQALPVQDGDGTSKRWKVEGWAGEVGFISSMSDHFCGTCNRLRITADGNLKVCLFDNAEVSLRDIMRAPGASTPSDPAHEQLLLDVVSLAVGNKAAKHAGMDLLEGMQNRSMVMIGAGHRARRIGHAGALVPLHLLAPSGKIPGHSLRAYSTAGRAPPSRLASLDQKSPAGTSASTQTTTSEPPTEYNGASGSARSLSGLTHLDATGRASMVSVSGKVSSYRQATAVGRIHLPGEVFRILQASYGEVRTSVTSPGKLSKGDVLGTARVAGIMAGKRTGELIPLCHPIGLEDLQVAFRLEAAHEGQGGWCSVRAVASCTGKTGVEMEALTAASTALLTVWDMTKALGGQTMCIEGLCVAHKQGGKSRDWRRADVDHEAVYDL